MKTEKPKGTAIIIGAILAAVRDIETTLALTGEVPITEDPLHLAYGLGPPSRVVQAWGTRALLDRYGNITVIETEVCRNAQLGVSKPRQELFERFVNEAGLPRIRELAQTLKHSDRREIRSRLERFCIAATVRGTGILSIGAYELPYQIKTEGVGDYEIGRPTAENCGLQIVGVTGGQIPTVRGLLQG